MEATAQRTEGELQARLAEVDAAIAAGEGDTLALLEEREELRLAVQAAALARQARADKEYRAKIEARRESYLRELNTELANLWRVMPELRWCLIGLCLLEQRIEELGRGSWEESTGLPFGAVRQLRDAISAALAGTFLGDEAFTPGKVSAPNTARKPGPTIHFPPDHRPPPGYSGVWPPEAYER